MPENNAIEEATRSAPHLGPKTRANLPITVCALEGCGMSYQSAKAHRNTGQHKRAAAAGKRKLANMTSLDRAREEGLL